MKQTSLSPLSIGKNLDKMGKVIGILSVFLGFVSLVLIAAGIYVMLKYRNLYKKTLVKVTKVKYCNKHTHHRKHSYYTDYYCSLTVEFTNKSISKDTPVLNTEGTKYNVGDTLDVFYNLSNTSDVKQKNPYYLGVLLLCIGCFMLLISFLKYVCSKYKSCSQLLAISWLANIFRPRHFY